MLVALLATAVPARGETQDAWDAYFASGDTTQEGSVVSDEDDISWGRWAIVNLALLFALGGAYAYAKKRKNGWPGWLKGRRAPRSPVQALRVAASLGLGNGQSVHLVEGNGFRVLVGSWSGGMTSLGPVPPAAAKPEAAEPASDGPRQRFPELVERRSARRPPVIEAPDDEHQRLTEDVIAQVRKLRTGALLAIAALGAAAVLAPGTALASPDSLGLLVGSFESAEGSEWIETALFALGVLTVLAVAPALLITLTSFTRLVIVFAFLRQALGTQNTPPNQVLIGLALFLTFFVMAPTFDQIKTQALDPYLAEEIDFDTALERGSGPLRDFMFRQTRMRDLELMVSYDPSGVRPANRAEVPMTALVPAFMISELRTAFEIGFLLYVPFLIVDLIVSTILLAMGMMVLPPIIISLPFKILLFLLVDGWNVLIASLLMGFS